MVPLRGSGICGRMGHHSHLRNTGWWYTYPSEKYESQLGLWFPIYIYIRKNKKCSKPPTRISPAWSIFTEFWCSKLRRGTRPSAHPPARDLWSSAKELGMVKVALKNTSPLKSIRVALRKWWKLFCGFSRSKMVLLVGHLENHKKLSNERLLGNHLLKCEYTFIAGFLLENFRIFIIETANRNWSSNVIWEWKVR